MTKQIDGQTWIPWTRETCPLTKVIHNPRNNALCMIGGCENDTCLVIGTGWVTYTDVLESDWRFNGKPCGTLVEPKWRPARIEDIDKGLRARFGIGGVQHGILCGWSDGLWYCRENGGWDTCEVIE
jgi:hypothetical protein